MNKSVFDQVFVWCVKKRSRIIFGFKLIYIFLLSLLFIGGWSIYSADKKFIFFYSLGLTLGRIAILVYILTTLPGITRRFGINHRFIQILMIFRRYLGICVFMLITIHFMWVRGIDILFKQIIIVPTPVFQLMGTGAYLLLMPMFLTSNDFSVKNLGKWWQIIHNATYIIIWLIFMHVAFQRISIWSFLVGTTAVLQVSSHLYFRLKMSKQVIPVSQ